MALSKIRRRTAPCTWLVLVAFYHSAVLTPTLRAQSAPAQQGGSVSASSNGLGALRGGSSSAPATGTGETAPTPGPSDGPDDSIHVVIVSRKFDGRRMKEKNDLIWSVLVQNLSPEEWGKVSLSVGASPEEIKAT